MTVSPIQEEESLEVTLRLLHVQIDPNAQYVEALNLQTRRKEFKCYFKKDRPLNTFTLNSLQTNIIRHEMTKCNRTPNKRIPSSIVDEELGRRR